MNHPLRTHQRQVHLDFHTSPHIPGVAADFDAGAFADQMSDAHVNSVTVFAKCHHGMCYYPTATGTRHPTLGDRDLLGEQIEALHRRGIRAPIYTTIAWEEDVAHRFPAWRQLCADGTFARCRNADVSKPAHPGGWWFNNFLHPDYQDYIEAHVEELLRHYDVDGIFFDILFFAEHACWSDASVAFREAHHLLDRDAATDARFQIEAQVSFANRFTRLVTARRPNATVVYNAPNPLFASADISIRRRHPHQTHWELESLPSGFWGYHHFPRLARSVGAWGKPWLGMTGRFQRMWGDFGGIKPQAALEYECFRSQAFGGANSVGDQLHPRGRLDAGAYDLIGKVYAQCKAAEPFYDGSLPMPQVGIVAPGSVDLPSDLSDKSIEGAIQLCEEAHYDAVVLDDASDLSGLELIILPDSVQLTPTLQAKLTHFVDRGGRLIVSHRSGIDASGRSGVPGLPIQSRGPVARFPNYWRARAGFSIALSRSDRVIYDQGDNVDAPGTEVLVERVLPYFNRTDLTFCSHAQTPPQPEPDAHPAVVRSGSCIYFADPVFREYRQSGNTAVRDAWRAAMKLLVGDAPFGEGLPASILSVPRRRDADLLLTLLHYIPTRKSIEIDTIDDACGFAGETLRLPAHVDRVVDFETGQDLPRHAPGQFELPPRKGRLLLTVPGCLKAMV